MDYKLKVSGEWQADLERGSLLQSTLMPEHRVRLDANNRWRTEEEARDYLRRLPARCWAVEEPLSVGDYQGCRALYESRVLHIILDESFKEVDEFQFIQETPAAWIINIRVSKMGGLLRALAVAAKCNDLGIPIVVGAQVGETSILSRAALAVADRYREALRAQEGAFGTHLLESDLCHPPVMFGAAGRLDPTAFSGRPGLGLSFVRDVLGTR